MENAGAPLEGLVWSQDLSGTMFDVKMCGETIFGVTLFGLTMFDVTVFSVAVF